MTTLTEREVDRPHPGRPRSVATIADLLHQLGDIPAERVRLHPFPGTATRQDVLDIDAHEGRLFELVDGVLVEKPMGVWESFIAGLILTELNNWVRPRNLGMVLGPDGMMRILPNQVRMPDVCFISPNRYPGGQPTSDPVPEISPDLAVEVLSDSNTTREIDRKRKEYFKSGTQIVWVVDPRSRTALVYERVDSFRTLGIDDEIDGGNVLPGFTLPLKVIFAGVPEDYR